MLKILIVIGTRPEAIKMAPVIWELSRRSEDVVPIVCVTGQHRQLLDQSMQLLRILPDYDLDLMTENQSLSGLTSSLFTRLDPIVEETVPDWVVAQGDTTSVLVAALTAFYRGVRFGHVEAGLRTQDKRRPFPEEINRRLADAVADAYFAPTGMARRALLHEGVHENQVHVTGNTVIDALHEIAGRDYEWEEGPLASLPGDGRLVLITAHRRESFGRPFRELCSAIRALAERFQSQGVHFVYPVHLNPNVRRPVQEILSGLPNISLLEPLDYLSFVHLMKRSSLILTDSGGIQEEAPGLGIPVLVMRDTTERPEGVDAGVVKLVGTSSERIVQEAARLLEDEQAWQAMAQAVNPYGDGHAAARICNVLLSS
jgi:UDP-N-acetylglucosamine 2-epimerase